MDRALSSSPRPSAGRPDPLPVSRVVPAPGAAGIPAANLQSAVTMPVDWSEITPLRRLAFWLGVVMVFLFFSVLSEIIFYLTGLNLRLLYVLTPPVILGMLLAGGLGRTFRHRASYYLIAFFLWMILATPFSSWPGGSAQRIFDYSRGSLIMLFAVAGLVIGWKEVRVIYYAIGAAGLVNLLTARFFMTTQLGRISLTLESGTIANPNDLAAHLLIVLPFLLFLIMDRKRSRLFRCLLFASFIYGLWVILGTASRGALIAIGVAFLCFLYHASAAQRVRAILLSGVMAVVLLGSLTQVASTRLASLFGAEADDSSQQSETARYSLFKKSLRYTFEHPFFGVGPDQFPNYEGRTSIALGTRGQWQVTHCSWTQISSECGLPGLIFYVAGLGSAILLVSRVHAQAKQRGLTEIADASLCYLVAMAGFLTAITFLSNAYRFYVPTMIGLAIAMHSAAAREFAAAPAGLPAQGFRAGLKPGLKPGLKQASL